MLPKTTVMKAAFLVPLLLVSISAVQYANGQTVGIVGLYATMTPDNSNQFIHNQFIATLRHRLGFTTTDINICPLGIKGLGTSAGCTFSLENGIWRPNSFNNNMYVLEGTLKATNHSGGNTNSKFFQLRADLTKTGETTTASGQTEQNLTGTISFGNGVTDYNVISSEFFPNNMTLVVVGVTQYP